MMYELKQDIKVRVERLQKQSRYPGMEEIGKEVKNLEIYLDIDDMGGEFKLKHVLERINRIEDEVCNRLMKEQDTVDCDLFFYSTVAKLLDSISRNLKDTGVPLSKELLSLKREIDEHLNTDHKVIFDNRLEQIIPLVQWHDILDQEISNLSKVLQEYRSLKITSREDKQSIIELFKSNITTDSELKVLLGIAKEHDLETADLEHNANIEIFSKKDE